MFDLIGDVHGCLMELNELLEKLGYEEGKHPDGRLPVFLGDLTDRGWYSFGVYHLVSELVKSGNALLVRGNHDDKLMRWAMGRNVMLFHGLDKTIAEFEKQAVDKQEVVDFFSNIPYFHSLDDNKLVAVHAAWHEKFWDYGPSSKKCRTWCLFAPNRGMREDGFPDRVNWVAPRIVKEDSPTIVYGHQPYKEVRVENKTYGIDTGCVFGGKLTALRYPEMELVSVDSPRQYAEGEVKWGEDVRN